MPGAAVHPPEVLSEYGEHGQDVDVVEFELGNDPCEVHGSRAEHHSGIG